jgi:protein associated with RNAse G/E
MQDDQGGAPIRVVKLRYDGQPLFAWQGRLLEEEPDHVLLAGRFNATSRDLGYVTLEHGDLFLEWYYFGRWYNVFQIYSRTGQLKGWYCNIGKPPERRDGELHYVDLLLDVFVYPDGRYLVLDEDEFAALKATALSPEEAACAEQGLAELLALVRERRLPSRPYSPALAEQAG